jgi:hypothetical protein
MSNNENYRVIDFVPRLGPSDTDQPTDPYAPFRSDLFLLLLLLLLLLLFTDEFVCLTVSILLASSHEPDTGCSSTEPLVSPTYFGIPKRGEAVPSIFFFFSFMFFFSRLCILSFLFSVTVLFTTVIISCGDYLFLILSISYY